VAPKVVQKSRRDSSDDEKEVKVPAKKSSLPPPKGKPRANSSSDEDGSKPAPARPAPKMPGPKMNKGKESALDSDDEEPKKPLSLGKAAIAMMADGGPTTDAKPKSDDPTQKFRQNVAAAKGGVGFNQEDDDIKKKAVVKPKVVKKKDFTDSESD